MIEDHAGDDRVIDTTETNKVKPGILSSAPSPKRPGEGDTFHFPEIMLNIITSSVSLSLAIPPRRDRLCQIRKARKAHLRKAGEVSVKA